MPLIDITTGATVSNTKTANFNPTNFQWLCDGGAIVQDTDPQGLKFVDPAPTVSVTTFLLLFTTPERVAVRAAVATDPTISDWWSVLNDPRTTTVDMSLSGVSGALAYLTAKGILAAGREAEILIGQLK